MNDYATARLRGLEPRQAADEAGYSAVTVPAHIEARCARAGLLPDRKAETERIRTFVRSIEAMREEARRDIVEALYGKRSELIEALITAATAGNVAAIDKALERLVGKDVLPVELSGKDGGPIEVDGMTPAEAVAIMRASRLLPKDEQADP